MIFYTEIYGEKSSVRCILRIGILKRVDSASLKFGEDCVKFELKSEVKDAE